MSLLVGFRQAITEHAYFHQYGPCNHTIRRLPDSLPRYLNGYSNLKYTQITSRLAEINNITDRIGELQTISTTASPWKSAETVRKKSITIPALQRHPRTNIYLL
jgi:hypothetical protein